MLFPQEKCVQQHLFNLFTLISSSYRFGYSSISSSFPCFPFIDRTGMIRFLLCSNLLYKIVRLIGGRRVGLDEIPKGGQVLLLSLQTLNHHHCLS